MLTKDQRLAILDQVRESIEAKDDVLAPASHRLQCCLETAIRLIDEAVEEEPRNEEIGRYMQDGLRQAMRFVKVFRYGDEQCSIDCPVCRCEGEYAYRMQEAVGEDDDHSDRPAPVDRDFYVDHMDFPPNFENGPNFLGSDY